MKRMKYVVALLLVLLLLGGLGYSAVYGLGEDKSGSLSSINLGLDLAGGVSITYQVEGEETPSKEDMSDTIYKLQQRVQQYSTEAQVYQEGSNRINIEIPGVTDANKILEELGQPGNLYFIAETDSEGNLNYQLDSTYGFFYVLNQTLEELQAEVQSFLPVRMLRYHRLHTSRILTEQTRQLYLLSSQRRVRRHLLMQLPELLQTVRQSVSIMTESSFPFLRYRLRSQTARLLSQVCQVTRQQRILLP